MKRRGGRTTRRTRHEVARPPTSHGYPQRYPWSEKPAPLPLQGVLTKDRGAGWRRHGRFRLVRYETGMVPERPSGAREPPGRGTIPTGWGPPPTPVPSPGSESPAQRGPRDLSTLGGGGGSPAGSVGERPSMRPGFTGGEMSGRIAVRQGVTDSEHAQQGHPLKHQGQAVRPGAVGRERGARGRAEGSVGEATSPRVSNHPLGQGRGFTGGAGRSGGA